MRTAYLAKKWTFATPRPITGCVSGVTSAPWGRGPSRAACSSLWARWATDSVFGYQVVLSSLPRCRYDGL